jgi:hypothetical protein
MLPKIVDLRDPNPNITFKFNQAAGFMKGGKTQIEIDPDCLAGFYPVSIKLSNGFNAVTRYQFVIVIEKSQGQPETKQVIKDKLSQFFDGPIPNLFYNYSKEENYFPAHISSVTYKGLVTIEISETVLVPIHELKRNSSSTRRLAYSETQIDQFLDNLVFKFSIVSQQETRPIFNWTCVFFNASTVQVQLYLERPFDVSADRQEQI